MSKIEPRNSPDFFMLGMFNEILCEKFDLPIRGVWFMDRDGSTAQNRMKVDVLLLEQALNLVGLKEHGGSIKDFIAERYGQEVLALVQEML